LSFSKTVASVLLFLIFDFPELNSSSRKCMDWKCTQYNCLFKIVSPYLSDTFSTFLWKVCLKSLHLNVASHP
jgi:hypothetical protein